MKQTPAKFFKKNGYCIINLFNNEIIENIKQEVNDKLNSFCKELNNNLKLKNLKNYHKLKITENDHKYFVKNSSRYIPSKNKNVRYFNLINKKPITPNLEELKINPRSRSAKLRYAVKINDDCKFDEFKHKFKYLTDIENLQFDK